MFNGRAAFKWQLLHWVGWIMNARISSHFLAATLVLVFIWHARSLYAVLRNRTLEKRRRKVDQTVN